MSNDIPRVDILDKNALDYVTQLDAGYVRSKTLFAENEEAMRRFAEEEYGPHVRSELKNIPGVKFLFQGNRFDGKRTLIDLFLEDPYSLNTTRAIEDTLSRLRKEYAPKFEGFDTREQTLVRAGEDFYFALVDLTKIEAIAGPRVLDESNIWHFYYPRKDKVFERTIDVRDLSEAFEEPSVATYLKAEDLTSPSFCQSTKNNLPSGVGGVYVINNHSGVLPVQVVFLKAYHLFSEENVRLFNAHEELMSPADKLTEHLKRSAGFK